MPAMLFYPTLGLALVLVLRKSAQHLFGAGPAFTLWLLPPLLAMLPVLPTLPSAWSITPMLQILLVMPSITAPAEATASTPDWLWPLWLAGAIAGLLRLAVHYDRLLHQGRPVPDTMQRQLQTALDGFDPRRLRLHPAGPACRAVGAAQPAADPGGFHAAFQAHQTSAGTASRAGPPASRRCAMEPAGRTGRRTVVVPPADVAGAAALPARSGTGLCDERVLRYSPQDEAGYAHALLQSAGMSPVPVLIP